MYLLCVNMSTDVSWTSSFLHSFKTCEFGLYVLKLQSPFTLGVPFSDAKFHTTCLKEGVFDLLVPYQDVFSNVENLLNSRLDSDNESGSLNGDGQRAYDRLLEFINGGKLDNFVGALTEHVKEKEFNILVANEIFLPLSGSMCVVDAVNATSSRKDVKLPREVGLKGLGMGFKDGFYGVPDMLIFPPKVTTESETISGSVPVNTVSSVQSEDNEDDNKSDDNDDKNSPDSKKQRKDEEKDEEGKDDSPGKTVVEGKSGKAAKLNPDDLELSQSIATAISFALVQTERHPELHTFPMLRVHPHGIEIFIYDTRSDCLLCGIYYWTHRSIFYLWLVLNHKLFPFKKREIDDRFKCGYSAVAATVVKAEAMYLVQKFEGAKLLQLRSAPPSIKPSR